MNKAFNQRTPIPCYNFFMNIAIIGPKGVLSSERSGGIETRVYEVGKCLVEQGHSVTVYARKKHMPGTPKFIEGMRIIYIPTLYFKNLEAIIYTFFATIHALFGRYDIYDYHGVGPSTLSWIPRLLRPSSRTFVTFHARDQFHQKWGIFARLYLRFGEWASVTFPHYCITVSHVLQVFCREHFGIETTYIPNGARAQFVQRQNYLDELGLRPKNYFLTVGRLLAVKGIQHAIIAFRSLDTDMELVIVGGGDEQYLKELQDLARGDHRVRFLGFQDWTKLTQLYGHAYALIQPSESEGLPLTVLEAMSHGVPPIVSNIDGNLEAAYRTGFTFENKNAKDLANVLAYTIAHPEEVQEQGEEARAVIETNFSWSVITEHIESLYITSFH